MENPNEVTQQPPAMPSPNDVPDAPMAAPGSLQMQSNDPRELLEQMSAPVTDGPMASPPPRLETPGSPQMAAITQKLSNLDNYGSQGAADIERLELRQLAESQQFTDQQNARIAKHRRSMPEFTLPPATLHSNRTVLRSLINANTNDKAVEVVTTDKDGNTLNYQLFVGQEASTLLDAFTAASRIT